MILFGDFETYCEKPIKHGTYQYAEACEAMLLAAAPDDAAPEVWDITLGGLMPDWLTHQVETADEYVFHNSMFDRSVARLSTNLRGLMSSNAWRQLTELERWHDTMVQALTHSMPGGLEKLGDVLKLNQDLRKQEVGKTLVRLFCIPPAKNLKRGRATRETHPAEWAQFVEYAGHDILAMREIHRKCPKWNYKGDELALWHLDQKINDRGFAVDLDLAHAAIASVKQEKARLKEMGQEMTGYDELAGTGVESLTKRDKLLQYILEDYGIPLPDLKKDTLERRIEDPDLPHELRDLLAVRLMASNAGTAKYTSLARGVSSDGRLRGTLQFCGASRTGRWAGRTFQPQNLSRVPKYLAKEWEDAAQAIKDGAVDLIYENPMEVYGSLVRGVIVPAKGKKLVVSDLSNIEGRKAAWLAGEEWKLNKFRDFDKGIGADLYKVAYAQAFNVAAEQVDEYQRQIGKVCLAYGTMVLTGAGWIPIQDVKINHLLWDGEEWVKHQGLLFQGRKPVINLASVYLTPDHLVLSGTQWKEAATLQQSSTALSQALAIGAARLPSRAISSALWVGFARYSLPAIVGALSTVLRLKTSGLAAAPAAPSVGAKLLRNVGGRMRMLCQKLSIGLGCSIGLRRLASAAPRPTTPAGQATAGAASAYAMNGSMTAPHFSRIAELYRVGTTLRWKWIDAIRTATMSPVIFALSRSWKIISTAARFAKCKLNLIGCEKKMLTYDLACAGPRTRFTIMSARGPLIVHNCELMLQYEGGVGAFITGAMTYRIDLDEMAAAAKPTIPADVWQESSEFYDWTVKQRRSTYGLPRDVFVACDALKRLWRHAHHGINSTWPALKAAATEAISNPGVWIDHGNYWRNGQNHTVGIKTPFRRDGAWLKCRLPSGRLLCYPSPRMEDDTITYMGVHQYTRKWTRIKTYGGKLFENITQAAARDVIAHGMVLAEKHGYEVVLSVHDELITEVPDTDEYSVDTLSELMATEPEYARGLPLASAGFEGYRYKKG